MAGSAAASNCRRGGTISLSLGVCGGSARSALTMFKPSPDPAAVNAFEPTTSSMLTDIAGRQWDYPQYYCPSRRRPRL